MVVKHPMMFLDAQAVAINKIDLAGAMEVDPSKLRGDVSRLNPKAITINTSCRNGAGIDDVIRSLGLKST
jgi:hydrogenase nickel incorporation protein HypB